MTTWRNRIVGHGERDPEQLLAHPGNTKIHALAQQQAMGGILDELGWCDEIKITQDDTVVDGHMRVALALRADAPTVPVTILDLTPAEAEYAILTFDPVGAMAAQDKVKLDDLLRDVQSGEAGVQAMLAELAEKSGLQYGQEEPADAEPQVDRAAELQDKWQVQPGDLWAMGEHRLLCGDATKAADVARVMEGEKAGLMVTDPPYGVDYDPMFRQEALGAADRRAGRVANDARADWLQAWDLFTGDVAYCWSGMLTALDALTSFKDAGFVVHAEIVWAKPHLPFGRGHYIARHESCWYLVRAGKAAGWCGDGIQTTVWELPLDATADGGHGTQKPLECMARPIRNHNAVIVYDPFLGSGTTFVACQNLGRKGRGIEIEPKYCAVTLERMATAFPGLDIHKLTD